MKRELGLCVDYCCSSRITYTSITCRKWTRATNCLTRIVLYTEVDVHCSGVNATVTLGGRDRSAIAKAVAGAKGRASPG